MRKYIFLLGTIMLALLILSIEPTYGLEEQKQTTEINSNVFFETILKEKQKNITKICSKEYCDTFHTSNLEKGIETFKKNYFQYLKTKTSEEEATAILLKGFPITYIEPN